MSFVLFWIADCFRVNCGAGKKKNRTFLSQKFQPGSLNSGKTRYSKATAPELQYEAKDRMCCVHGYYVSMCVSVKPEERMMKGGWLHGNVIISRLEKKLHRNKRKRPIIKVSFCPTVKKAFYSEKKYYYTAGRRIRIRRPTFIKGN